MGYIPPNGPAFASETIGVPYVTVSPSSVPDGSNFGGWTPVTGVSVAAATAIFTNGIQEAINYMSATTKGGTVILRSSLGAFMGVGSGANPTLHGVHLLPGVVLTSDRPAFRSSTTNQPGADIIADSNFAPDAAFPANSTDGVGPMTVIGTCTNASAVNTIFSGFGVRNLVILITTLVV
ncbi:MAG: hypothetical protein L3K08_04225, partial [Thermoplasmata archaeon]|nr:hypothetical protein [Thermoplasmata archaeon]